MNPTLSFSSRNRFQRIGLAVLLFAVAMIAAACGGATPTPIAPTPTTTPEGSSPTEPLTAVPALGGTSVASVIDACSLATKPEVETVLGQPVIAVKPGSDATSIPGGTSYFCTYLGGGLALIVSVVDLGSPDAAGKELIKLVDNMKTSNPSATIAAESGLGDKSYWTATANGCGFNVLKGSKVYSVTIGGTIGDPASHKPVLRTLTQSVGAKL
jgi:hypothetical protein